MTEQTGPPHAGAGPAVLAFGAFRLDAGNALLTEGTRALELPPKAFAVLCHLASRPGLLVTKDQLLDAVWQRRFVSESVLKTAVNAIRSALGDDPREPRFIETVARRGYRFIGSPSTSSMSEAAPAAPLNGAPARVEAVALIGRDQASAQLAAWLAAAQTGQRQLVLMGGEAGIGKSSLIRHTIDVARARGVNVAIGQCVDQAGGGEPYLPILDALAELARGPASAVWMAALRQAAPTWLAQLPWLVTEADQVQLRRELAGAAQDRMLREFGALLDVAATTQPLLLVIEDLHWGDHATVSLLDYLARRRGPGRWMLVASFRPTDLVLNDHPMQALRQELRMHKLCCELVLEPFTEREVDAYLLRRLGPRATAQHEALARALHAHTEGLPLFLVNVVDDLEGEEAFSLDAHASAWADLAAMLARLHLPATVVGSIERQIRRLPGDLRDLLEAASVVGLEFSHPLLASVLRHDPDAIRDRCDGLARRAEWLRGAGMAAGADGSVGGRYAFRHALYRRVFYERCAPARRLQLHLRAADALQLQFGSHGDRIAAELAQHFEGARDTAVASGVRLESATLDAVAWRLRAARAAVSVHAPVDALAHFARAEQAELAPAEQVRVMGECAALHQLLGNGARARKESERALAAARAVGNAVLVQEAMLQLAQMCLQNDDPSEAIRWIDELLGADVLSPATRATALVAKADALGGMGRLSESDALAAEALQCLPPDADEARARHFAGRVSVHFQRGEYTVGLPVIDAALSLFERIGDTGGATTMAISRGVFLMSLDQSEAAESALLDALARARTHHDVSAQRRAILNLVKLRTDRGDADSSLALLESGWSLSHAFDGPVTECVFLSAFFYCNYLRGDLGTALNDASRVLASAEGLSSVYWRLGSSSLVCGLFIQIGDLDTACELVDTALAQPHAHEVRHQWLRALTHRAWLDVLVGHATQALTRLNQVRDSKEPVQPEDFAAMARVRAQAQVALGDAAGALATLAAFNGAPTQEVWASMLALRLHAQVQLNAVVSADLSRAVAELSDSRVPALESTQLRQALVDALRAAGQVVEADTQEAALAAHRTRLLASLSAHPARQQLLLRVWSAAAQRG